MTLPCRAEACSCDDPQFLAPALNAHVSPRSTWGPSGTQSTSSPTTSPYTHHSRCALRPSRILSGMRGLGVSESSPGRALPAPGPGNGTAPSASALLQAIQELDNAAQRGALNTSQITAISVRHGLDVPHSSSKHSPHWVAVRRRTAAAPALKKIRSLALFRRSWPPWYSCRSLRSFTSAISWRKWQSPASCSSRRGCS